MRWRRRAKYGLFVICFEWAERVNGLCMFLDQIRVVFSVNGFGYWVKITQGVRLVF